MSLTLFETLNQIDPYVKLNDGTRIATVKKLLTCVDPSDPAEYVLTADAVGRFIIYRLDIHGRATSPPCYVEEKSGALRGAIAPAQVPPNFGAPLHGFV